ncbi:MAG: hypothetical protein H6730_05355 [Deltaproteobacteria bacterium]|nr:hypothetical protein [Deltaproteobacteria bacterium]
MTLPLVRVPRIILSECNERLVAQRAESDGGGPCFRVASSVDEELRALLGAVDGAIMLLELCGWRVSRVAFVEKASGSSKSDVLDLDASSWLRTPRQSAADATWAVPVISGPSAASFANTSRWELRFELGAHPGVSERFRVDLTGLSGRLRVEADGTVVQSVTSGAAIGADGAFAELHGAGGLADQLLQRLGALLAATPDLDRPGDGSGMLGLWATGEWRSGPRGSAGILREWVAWLGPLRTWMTSALTDTTARADFLRAIALPRARGGLSVVEHVEKVRGAGQPMREPASLDLVAVHRAIEDSLSSEGRWRSQGNFQNAILKSLSLGDLLLLLQNEGVIDTLNAVSIDPLLGLDILDAIAGGHVPSDLEWSVVMAFVRQYPTHVRAREAVAALIAAAAGHPVTFRVEVYESLLSILAVAPYSPGPPEGPPTVDECGAWLLDLLLIDTAAEDLEGYLLGTRAALDRKLSGAQADDRFARALIEFGLFHPDVAARYSAAQTAAAVYAALGGTGFDDPGRAALRARFDDLCALATTCAGWDRELGSVDPGNALADDLEAIMDALGLLEPNLDGIDWREVDRRTEQRLQAALLADAGDIKRPDQYYTPGTGYTFDRQTQPYLLLLAACDMARDSGPEPRFSSGLRRRFDPLSAERVLDELRRSSGVLRDIFARAPLLARDEVVAETFPDRSIEAIFDAHEAALLDECTVAWVATMPPETRSKFVDGRILPMLAVDMARARDVAASFAIRLAARDPASAFGDFSPTEGDRLADLMADAAPDGTDLQEARKFGTGLVRISGPTIYHARFALSLQEALHRSCAQPRGRASQTPVWRGGSSAPARRAIRLWRSYTRPPTPWTTPSRKWSAGRWRPAASARSLGCSRSWSAAPTTRSIGSTRSPSRRTSRRPSTTSVRWPGPA